MNKVKSRLSFIKRSIFIFSMSDFVHIIYYYFVLRHNLTQKLFQLKEKHFNNNPDNSWDASKYLDFDIWVLENLWRIFKLKLHHKKKLKILDVGTGCGFFPFFCNYFGHEAECTDLDTSTIYNEIIYKLNLKRQVIRINSFTKPNIEGNFDLITAFLICFNNYRHPNIWHISEWEFFLECLMENNLNPGGKIFLLFNAETRDVPISKELLAYFSAKNAKIEGNTVYITNNYQLNSA